MSDSRRGSHRPMPLSVLSQIRRYEDPAALDRVWTKLASHRQHSRVSSPSMRLLAAAALLGSGIFVGMLIERGLATPNSEPSPFALAVAEAPAGQIQNTTAPRRSRAVPRPTRSVEDKKTSPRRVSRGSAFLSADVGEMNDEDFFESILSQEAQSQEPEEEVVPPPSKPAWLLLAERGDFAGAFQELDQSGGFDVVLASGSPDELMTLVDVARYVGRQGRAIQVLRVVTEKYQGDPNAPLAAMMLGNLLHRAGDAAGASAAFALNRRLSPGGDFAEDALVREFDMAMAAADLSLVQELQSQYEKEFPEGRHLSALHSEAARLAESLANSEGSPDSSEHADGKSGDSDEANSGETTSGRQEPPAGETGAPGESETREASSSASTGTSAPRTSAPESSEPSVKDASEESGSTK